MTPFEKGRLIFIMALTLLAGIFAGWEGAASVFVVSCFILGAWTVLSTVVDAALPPQEPPQGPPVYDAIEDADWRSADPTRPQDDKTHNPIIDLENYKIRKGIGK